MISRRPDAPGSGRERPDATMSLLADLFAGRLLDPGYADAAARRAAAGDLAPRGRLRGTGVLLVLVLVGVLLAAASAEVRRSQPVAAEQRSRLVAQIRARTGDNDALQQRLEQARDETERARAMALARSAEGRRVRGELSTAAAAAAATPISGDGLVVTVDDADRAEQGDRRGDEGRVYDQDLQVLVNGLWAAGAVAIAVNGQRLTPTTAIRSAGEAVLVDYRPLSGPYRVTAVGDPGRMLDAFGGSAADRRLRALEDRFGIRYRVRRVEGLRLPAAGVLRLRHARAAGS
ncbi:DUF881 domain-containing protein [Actinomadura sp. NPDC047616]|uniref:DUF881 domain-containing protein n=1 Tax=Actinomadura sp. NPDC047616 TaxID=3155914 RepID=UPI0033C7368F